MITGFFIQNYEIIGLKSLYYVLITFPSAEADGN